MWTPDLSERSGPRYLGIADALAADVRQGLLEPGSRLPTHRDLARELGVTVGTVSRAYAEAERRGLVTGEVGRGTFVLEPDADEEEQGAELDLPEWPDTDSIDLSMNMPPSAGRTEEDVALALALEALSSRPGVGALLQYQPHAGAAHHRAAGADWIGRVGLEVDPKQVLVCSGSQHAMAVCFSTLTKPGDVVLTESLTYAGMKGLANLFHFKLRGVPMDEHGMLPEAFQSACESTGAKFLYCVPTLQNPTNTVMPVERRKEVAAIARRHGVVIIEDDIHGLLPSKPVPPIAHFASDITCYIASISKSIAPGLRISYLAAPENLVERLTPGLWLTTWMASPLTAEVATLWIQNGTADRILEKRRKEAAARQKLAADILAGVQFQSHPFAYHIWLNLPEPWRAEDFTQQALKQRVVVTPPSAFIVGRERLPHAVRVCLGSVRERGRLAGGLRILADILTRSPEPCSSSIV